MAARREMEMDEGQGTSLDELHVSGLHIRDAAVRQACRGHHRRELGGRGSLLEENKMGLVLPQQGRAAGHVRPFEVVEGQDREEL